MMKRAGVCLTMRRRQIMKEREKEKGQQKHDGFPPFLTSHLFRSTALRAACRCCCGGKCSRFALTRFLPRRLTLKFSFGSGDSAKFLHFCFFRKSCDWIQENCAEEIFNFVELFVRLLSLLQVPSALEVEVSQVRVLCLFIFWSSGFFGEEFLSCGGGTTSLHTHGEFTGGESNYSTWFVLYSVVSLCFLC